MPSIFIWKETKPNTSKKTIRVYSGSNWILEDNDYSSKSFKFLEQIVIPGFNDSVITFNVKIMPQDWTGTELLEVTQVNYELIKSDNYGTLEHIGNWMRFTSTHDINYKKESLEMELTKITTWMNNKKEKQLPFQPPKKYQNTQKIPYNNHHHKKTTILDPNIIQQNFQEFLIKFDFNSFNTNMLSNSSIAY